MYFATVSEYNISSTTSFSNFQAGSAMALPFLWSIAHATSLAMKETYQKFQRVEYMIWLSKVFGDVISF